MTTCVLCGELFSASEKYRVIVRADGRREHAYDYPGITQITANRWAHVDCASRGQAA